MTDRQLIAQAVAGDAAAARAIYDTHVDRIYRLACRMAGDEELAQDLTQETFIRAFEKLGDFRGDSALSTWIHSVAVSVILNGLRSVKRLRTREAPMDEGLLVVGTKRQAEPDLKDRLARAIDALPPGYRMVFVMHDVEGYTHEEIGKALGVETGTSKAQLFRARAKLRTALEDFRGEWVS